MNAITGITSAGEPFEGRVLSFDSDHTVCEVFAPFPVFQTSELIQNFKIHSPSSQTYAAGQAVVTGCINTPSSRIVSLDIMSPALFPFQTPDRSANVGASYAAFFSEAQKSFGIQSRFKIAVADLCTFLFDLRHWLDQLDQQHKRGKEEGLQQMTRLRGELFPEVYSSLQALFASYEEALSSVSAEASPAHRNYAKRHLHPYLLCAPFVHRSYLKPLGYAGDYEMVNMIFRNPFEGASLYSQMVNAWFLRQPPAQAHRNRISHLKELLLQEALEARRQKHPLKVLSVGCGPAIEVQQFLEQDHSQLLDLEFSLLDFNQETLHYLAGWLNELRMKRGREVRFRLLKKSVAQLLKERPGSTAEKQRYHFVYCAGLFDYLGDSVCTQVLSSLHNLLLPGGRLVATNVDVSNPSKPTMESVLDWHLIYRNGSRFSKMVPEPISPDSCTLCSDPTGVNLYLEISKS